MCLISSHSVPHIFWVCSRRRLRCISIAVIVECLDSNVTIFVRVGEISSTYLAWCTKAQESLTNIKEKFDKTSLDIEAHRNTITQRKYSLWKKKPWLPSPWCKLKQKSIKKQAHTLFMQQHYTTQMWLIYNEPELMFNQCIIHLFKCVFD